MNDLMLYVMVVSIFGLFGWAAFEYAKAGFQSWKERHRAPITSEPTGNATFTPSDRQTQEEQAPIATESSQTT